MGKVAIDCLAARQTIYSPFVRYVKHYSSLFFRLYAQAGFALETLLSGQMPLSSPADILVETPDLPWRELPWQKSES
jgi:hypothetical protein